MFSSSRACRTSRAIVSPSETVQCSEWLIDFNTVTVHPTLCTPSRDCQCPQVKCFFSYSLAHGAKNQLWLCDVADATWELCLSHAAAATG